MRSLRRREKRSVLWWAPPIDSVTKGTGSHDLDGEPVEAGSDEKGLDKVLRVSLEESMGVQRLAWAK